MQVFQGQLPAEMRILFCWLAIDSCKKNNFQTSERHFESAWSLCPPITWGNFWFQHPIISAVGLCGRSFLFHTTSDTYHVCVSGIVMESAYSATLRLRRTATARRSPLTAHRSPRPLYRAQLSLQRQRRTQRGDVALLQIRIYLYSYYSRRYRFFFFFFFGQTVCQSHIWV